MSKNVKYELLDLIENNKRKIKDGDYKKFVELLSCLKSSISIKLSIGIIAPSVQQDEDHNEDNGYILDCYMKILDYNLNISEETYEFLKDKTGRYLCDYFVDKEISNEDDKIQIKNLYKTLNLENNNYEEHNETMFVIHKNFIITGVSKN